MDINYVETVMKMQLKLKSNAKSENEIYFLTTDRN